LNAELVGMSFFESILCSICENQEEALFYW
jgi:hypothetical protein